MRNVYLYFSILLGLAMFLVIVVAVVCRRERLASMWKRGLNRKSVQREDFYCVRTNLKQINESFYVAQILFTNRKDCNLAAQSETRHRSSEE